MKIKNSQILILILATIIFSGCSFYEWIGEYKDCKEYYGLDGKSYKTKVRSDEIANTWESDGYKVFRDTFYTENKKWMSPQMKILDFKNSGINIKINYILFTVSEFKNRTNIQLHGMCLSEKTKEFLPKTELKKINAIVKKELVDRVMK